MAIKSSQIKRGLPSTTSITDANLKRIIDGLVLEIKRMQQEIEINNRK